MAYEISERDASFFVQEIGEACNIPVKNTVHNLLNDHSWEDDLLRVYTYENQSPALELVEIIRVGVVDEIDLAFWKRVDSDTNDSKSFEFGFGKNGSVYRICSIVDRGSAPQCSYALFDQSYLNSDVIGTMVCTDEDSTRPLVIRKDPSSNEDIVVLAADLCKKIEILSDKANSEEINKTARSIAESLKLEVDTNLFADSYDFNRPKRIPGVAEALAVLATKGVSIVRVETVGSPDGQISIVTATMPETKQIKISAYVPALSDAPSAETIMTLVPNDEVDDVTIVDGEKRYLFGEKTPSAERIRLHQIAAALGSTGIYTLDKEKDKVIPGLLDSARDLAESIQQLLNDARGQLAYTEQKNAKNKTSDRKYGSFDLPFEIEKVIQQFREKHKYLGEDLKITDRSIHIPLDDIELLTGDTDAQTLIRILKFVFPANKITYGIFNKQPIPLSFTPLELHNEEYGNVFYNQVFNEPTRLADSVVINCPSYLRPDDQTVCFGASKQDYMQDRAITGLYINPLNSQKIRKYSRERPLVNHCNIYSLGGPKVIIQTPDIVSSRMERLKYKDASWIIDTDNYKPKNYPRGLRKILDQQVEAYKKAKRLTEEKGINFSHACEVSLRRALANLPSGVEALIPQIL